MVRVEDKLAGPTIRLTLHIFFEKLEKKKKETQVLEMHWSVFFCLFSDSVSVKLFFFLVDLKSEFNHCDDKSHGLRIPKKKLKNSAKRKWSHPGEFGLRWVKERRHPGKNRPKSGTPLSYHAPHTVLESKPIHDKENDDGGEDDDDEDNDDDDDDNDNDANNVDDSEDDDDDEDDEDDGVDDSNGDDDDDDDGEDGDDEDDGGDDDDGDDNDDDNIYIYIFFLCVETKLTLALTLSATSRSTSYHLAPLLRKKSIRSSYLAPTVTQKSPANIWENEGHSKVNFHVFFSSCGAWEKLVSLDPMYTDKRCLSTTANLSYSSLHCCCTPRHCEQHLLS